MKGMCLEKGNKLLKENGEADGVNRRESLMLKA
jgi:hypothetical protein